MTIKQMKAVCRNNNIKGYSKMTRVELEEIVNKIEVKENVKLLAKYESFSKEDIIKLLEKAKYEIECLKEEIQEIQGRIPKENEYVNYYGQDGKIQKICIDDIKSMSAIYGNFVGNCHTCQYDICFMDGTIDRERKEDNLYYAIFSKIAYSNKFTEIKKSVDSEDEWGNLTFVSKYTRIK